MKEFLECGKIVNTHGLKGEVRVMPWCDSPEVLASLKRVFIQSEEVAVEAARVHGSIVIVKFKSVNDINSAVRLKNKVLFAAREDFQLEADEFFIQDAIGLDVYDESGAQIGKLSDVLNLPASDVFVITGSESGERLVPNVPEFVKNVDIENGRIVVSLIDGM